MLTHNNLSAVALEPGLLAKTGGLTPTVDEGARTPSNSELRKIAEDISGALKYSFASVAADPNANMRPGSVEADIKTYLKGLDATKVAKYTGVSKTLVGAKDVVRMATFGRAGKRSAAEHLGVAGGFDKYDSGLAPIAINRGLLGVKTPEMTVSRDMFTDTPDGLLIRRELMGDFDFEAVDENQSDGFDALEDEIMDRSRLEDIWGSFGSADETQTGSDFEAAVTDKIGLWVRRVKCVDETNPESLWFVNLHDTIAIGGQSIDEDGDVRKISERHVGSGFDDGDQKLYGNSFRFHGFSMREANHWPKSYRVIMMLAEKDHGGFQKLLNALYAHIRDKVKQAITNAVTGALAGYLGPVIAKAIGEVAAWIVDALIGWLINLFGDDVFPAHIASVTTPSMAARWRYSDGSWGNPQSPMRTAHFYGHGGHYLVNYYWKFYS